MNYIKKLEAENAALRQAIKATDAELLEILVYLAGQKFVGVENNFVNPSDIRSRIQEARNQSAEFTHTDK